MKLTISNLLKSYEDRKMSRRELVDPSVDTDLVAAALEDGRQHVGMQHGIHAGDKERRRDGELIEHLQDARHSALRAVIRR